MSKSLLFHANELDAPVRDGLEAMLRQSPDEEKLQAAMDRLRRLEPPDRAMFISSERIRRRIVVAISAACLLLLLWMGAQTKVWAQVSQDFQRAGEREDNPQPTRAGTPDALPNPPPVKPTPVSPVLRFVLILHVFSLMAGYLGFLVAWGNSLRVWLVTLWRGKVTSHGFQGEGLHRMTLVIYGLGILLGSVWSVFTWGRLWSWDVRETFAVLTMGIGCLWYSNVSRDAVDSAAEITRRALTASFSWWLIVLMYSVTPLYLPNRSYGASAFPPTVIALLLAVNLVLVFGSRGKFRRTI